MPLSLAISLASGVASEAYASECPESSQWPNWLPIPGPAWQSAQTRAPT